MANYSDFDDQDGDEFYGAHAGPAPDLVLRQALASMEQAQSQQRQVLAAQQREIVGQMLEVLAQEGYVIDRAVDGADLAAAPSPAARQQRLQFMRATRAKRPVPTAPPRPFRFGRNDGVTIVAGDPALGRQHGEASYADIVARATKGRARA